MARPLEVRTIIIDSNYTKAQRRAIANLIIAYVRRRTLSGISETNKAFVGRTTGTNSYSGEYTKTKEFKNSGKSPRPINLTLTGGMLNSIEVVDINIPGRITYGFKKANMQNEKASWMSEKGYRFLGLTRKEQNDIIKGFGPASPGPVDNNLVSSFTAEAIRKIIGS